MRCICPKCARTAGVVRSPCRRSARDPLNSVLPSVLTLWRSVIGVSVARMPANRVVNGPRIRAIRTEQGIGLRELATDVGWDAGHLSRVERGKKGASQLLIGVLARALSVTSDEITKAAA